MAAFGYWQQQGARSGRDNDVALWWGLALHNVGKFRS